MNKTFIIGIAAILTIGLSLIGAQTQQIVNAAPSDEQVQKVCEKTNGKNPHCVRIDSGSVTVDSRSYQWAANVNTDNDFIH